jgi:hypothetical protein
MLTLARDRTPLAPVLASKVLFSQVEMAECELGPRHCLFCELRLLCIHRIADYVAEAVLSKWSSSRD